MKTYDIKYNREIARVKAMRARATSGEELARLTNLLILLNSEYIAYLEKLTVKRRAA